jgi:predicted RNA polymerase sigma factor
MSGEHQADTVVREAKDPVVELNRAVAVRMAFGPAAGLELVDALWAEPSLKSYHLLPVVRGDLLRKLGRCEEAGAEFQGAASLAENVRERELMQRRAAECAAERMGGLETCPSFSVPTGHITEG